MSFGILPNDKLNYEIFSVFPQKIARKNFVKTLHACSQPPAERVTSPSAARLTNPPACQAAGHKLSQNKISYDFATSIF